MIRSGAQVLTSLIQRRYSRVPTTLILLPFTVSDSLGKRSGHMAVGVNSTIFTWAIIVVNNNFKKKKKEEK